MSSCLWTEHRAAGRYWFLTRLTPPPSFQRVLLLFRLAGLGRFFGRRLQQAGFAEGDGEDATGGLLFRGDQVDGFDDAVGILVVDGRDAEANVLVAVAGFSRAGP